MVKDEVRKPSLFDDSEDESDGGVKLQINSEFAKRFEHNKKREELHRLEEKYKSNKNNGDKSKGGDDDYDSDSSSDVTEDENGFLATEELDAQLNATLQAIRNKDPRVYDGKTTFYTPIDETSVSEPSKEKKKEKPVFLQDYHREKLLRGDVGADDEDDKEPPRTYTQEQEDLKKSIRDEIKAQMQADSAADSDEEEFMKAKEGPKPVPVANGIHPSRASQVKAPKPEPADADKDPELFLSNFMAARAWVEEDGNGWQAFESDDQDDGHLEKAEEWEAAYNLRFEDPHKSNEVLKTYARDVTAARSVRREEKTARKRQRELEREKKEAEKQERREERARLRRLKIEEAESKLQQIKKVAGLSGKTLKEEDWQKILEDAWDNDKWEEKMREMFDDEYYAEGDRASEDEAAEGSKKKKKIKKPKWDDDIDIKDIVPDFEERPDITLTDEDQQEAEDGEDDEDGAPSAKRQKTSKDRKRERLASQKAARQERAKIEALVDARMDIDEPELLAGASSKKGGADKDVPRFSYRETWPETFGLTTRDILMASDADLNEYAGLKKLAHFRDPDKQAKDRKRLGKKARLRKWRRDTFGPEFEHEPPVFNPGGDGPLKKEDGQGREGGKAAGEQDDANVVEGGKKKRKRSGRKKRKSEGAAAEE
ncbi:hypothetical protein DL771_000156 [Monosporascus sp. 5C6A]|nr:hypothetical protein DL771_000156 [Monosporascus sp. 5C6A]